MSNEKYIVEINNGGKPFWLAPWEGDPGRTLVKDFARVFKIKEAAEMALKIAQRNYPDRNLDGKIITIS